MSRSIHTTRKDVKGLTKEQVDEQAADPNSDLRVLARKSSLKEEVKKSRKNIKFKNKVQSEDNSTQDGGLAPARGGS